MNDNKYGLSSGVYTQTLGRGMRVSKAVRAGITFVNTYRLISPMAPFGGIKDSGYGKEAGIESIKEYTRIKTTWYNSSDKPMTRPIYNGIIFAFKTLLNFIIYWLHMEVLFQLLN